MEKYFRYLARLRDSGQVNMFGAIPYLQKEFPELAFDENKTRQILTAWMDSFKGSESEQGRPLCCGEANNG